MPDEERLQTRISSGLRKAMPKRKTLQSTNRNDKGVAVFIPNEIRQQFVIAKDRYVANCVSGFNRIIVEHTYNAIIRMTELNCFDNDLRVPAGSKDDDAIHIYAAALAGDGVDTS